MDFLNKTKASLLNAGSTLSHKANNVSETVALTVKIREDEKKIETTTAALGKTVLEQFAEDAKRLCPEIYEEIVAAKEQLEKDKKELALRKGLQICPNCGSEQRVNAVHCSACGEKLPEAVKETPVAEEAAASVVTCKNCGTVLPSGSAFCPNCGTKAED